MVTGSSVFKIVSGLWSLLLSVDLASVLVALTVWVFLWTLTSLGGFHLSSLFGGQCLHPLGTPGTWHRGGPKNMGLVILKYTVSLTLVNSMNLTVRTWSVYLGSCGFSRFHG